MKSTVQYLYLACGLLVFAVPASAQVSAGADVVSRYIWRGIDFGESLSFQPYVSYATGNLEVGVWSSYALADGGANNELDWYASYTVGPFSFGATDYFFPAPEARFFDGDEHTLEPFVGYSGLFDVTFAMNVTNDDAQSTYLELGKGVAVGGSEVALFAGGTLSGSAATPSIYGTTGPALINLGFSVSKAIKLTESFSLPVQATYVLNPELERTYLFFGISL